LTPSSSCNSIASRTLGSTKSSKELKSIREHIAELEEILSSDKKLKQVITGELKEVQKSYGDDRRTQIVDKVDELSWKISSPTPRSDHRQPCRLHQAHRRGHLPPPIARRQRPHRSAYKKKTSSISLRRLGAQLHFALHF